MDIQDVKIGMKVRLDNLCNKTNRTFSVTSSMRKLRGTIQVVKGIGVYEKKVRLAGWAWHADDLLDEEGEQQKPLKKIKPEIFNPNDLVF